jgi:hypothetical protein
MQKEKEETMKNIVTVLVSSLVFAGLFVGTGIASEYERSGKDYEHSERHEDKIYGTVEKLPKDVIGTWVVDGKEILVTKDTFVKEEYGKPAVGAYVEIEGSYTGKTFTAHKIEIKGKHK